MLFFCDQLHTTHQAVTSIGCSWYDRIRAFKQDPNFPQDSVAQLWPLAYISSMTDAAHTHLIQNLEWTKFATIKPLKLFSLFCLALQAFENFFYRPCHMTSSRSLIRGIKTAGSIWFQHWNIAHPSCQLPVKKISNLSRKCYGFHDQWQNRETTDANCC